MGRGRRQLTHSFCRRPTSCLRTAEPQRPFDRRFVPPKSPGNREDRGRRSGDPAAVHGAGEDAEGTGDRPANSRCVRLSALQQRQTVRPLR